MVVHQNGWFIRENLTKMDDLGVPSFQETRMCFFLVGSGVPSSWQRGCLTPSRKACALTRAGNHGKAILLDIHWEG